MTERKPEPTRNGYGRGLVRAGERDPRVVALDADLAESTRAHMFAKKWPDRFFQMGISEQDMVGTAAGLASSGKIAFASTFAIFSERAFEQIRNMVARPRLNVKVVGSHGGILTGSDGSSAQAIEDVGIYRTLPNMKVVVPADAPEAEEATLALAADDGPAYLRTTRDKVTTVHDPGFEYRLGRAEVLVEGEDVALLACGALVGNALEAAETLKAEGISALVANVHTIKPIDRTFVSATAARCGRIVTAEDHNIVGGLGSAVAEVVVETRPVPMVRVGVKDSFGESGEPADLYEKYGLTARHVADGARALMAPAPLAGR